MKLFKYSTLTKAAVLAMGLTALSGPALAQVNPAPNQPADRTYTTTDDNNNRHSWGWLGLLGLAGLAGLFGKRNDDTVSTTARR
ncbi:MAG: WGxxGxxG family protein [Candidatus Competibacteraceae bacterium]